MRGSPVLVAGVGLLTLVTGCGGATVRMQSGVPIEIERGYCFVSTKYKQHGRDLDTDDVYRRIGRNEKSRSYIEAGNSWAIASVAAVAVTLGTFTAATIGEHPDVDMDDDAKTALYATSVGAGLLSVFLCVTSDGKFVKAVEVYNEGLPKAVDPDAPDPADRAGEP